MKRQYRFLLVTFLSSGLVALACAEGEMVGNNTGKGGNGGRGGTSGNGGSSSAGTGGTVGTGFGGQVGTGFGGQIGTGTGGVVGTGLGGQIGGTGTGGAGVSFMPVCTPTATAISDMEDGHDYFGTTCPKGAWYLSTGGGGTITAGLAAGTSGGVIPVSITDRAPSTKAIHVAGSGQTTATGFVSLSASLNSPSATQTGQVNAGAYAGVRFFAKISGPIILQVSDADTHPAGQRCTGASTMQCYDHAFTTLTASTGWMEYMIPFTALSMQGGWGNPTQTGAAFPKAAIYTIEWKVQPTGTPAPTVFPAWDIWVDDLSFY